MGRMRQVDRSIEVKFLADMKELTAASKAAQKSLGGVSGGAFQFNNVTAALSQILGYAQEVFDTVLSWAKAASDYDQALGKSRAVFGRYSSIVEDFARTSAEAWGQSRQQAINYAGDIGNVFASLGVAQGAAASFGTEALKLAADMSAFANLDIEQALTAIRSGLVGETEPLRRFGIVVYDAAVKAKALEQGLWDGKGTMDESAKVMARWLLIQERAVNMTGSFAREQDTLQVQTQKLNAEIENLRIQLGEGFVDDTVGATKALRGLTLMATDLDRELRKSTGGQQGLVEMWARGIPGLEAAAGVLGALGGATASYADKADRAAVAGNTLGESMRLNANYQKQLRVEASQNAYIDAMNTKLTGMTERLKAQAAAFEADRQALGNYLGGLAGIRGAMDAAFNALKDPTLRESLKTRYKDLTGKAFIEASRSSDPERRAQAQAAAVSYGEALVAAGKKFKPTGNPVIDAWIKKGIQQANYKSDLDKLLSRMQGYLNRNPLSLSVGDIIAINTASGSRSLSLPTGRSASRSATTINVNVNGGDPQAIVAAIRRYTLVSGGKDGFNRAITR